jgi:non-heme chloroperoxidase
MLYSPQLDGVVGHASTSSQEQDMDLQRIFVNGVELHYVERGQGIPVVLIHGGLADYREWSRQMERFAQSYRVIAYSRRYNYPNQAREIAPDHSALVEAEDLAAFLHALDLDRCHIVGYSYGAFTALCLALAHPEVVRALVLAEPPLLRWAVGMPGGDALFADFMNSIWVPVGQAFRRGDKALALDITAHAFLGEDGLSVLPDEARQMWQGNLGEWEALTTSHDAFPMVAKERVAQVQLPTLSLTAERTLDIHQLVNDELERLLPLGRREIIREATHEMWTEQPEACGARTLQFLAAFT